MITLMARSSPDCLTAGLEGGIIITTIIIITTTTTTTIIIIIIIITITTIPSTIFVLIFAYQARAGAGALLLAQQQVNGAVHVTKSAPAVTGKMIRFDGLDVLIARSAFKLISYQESTFLSLVAPSS
jgi:uncharacterized SAM-binding protein YcdF (DUF218 family)